MRRAALLPPLAVLAAVYPLLPDAAAAGTYVAVAVGSAAAMLRWGRWRGEPALRWWWFLWAGVVLWLLGDLFGYGAWFADVEQPLVEVVVYVPAYGALGAGLWGLTRMSTSVSRREVALDMAIVGLAAGWLLWQLVIQPARSSPGFSDVLVTYAYPLLDLVLLTGLLRLLLGRHRSNRSLQLLAAALLAVFVADGVYALLAQAVPHPLAQPIDVGWLAFYVLMAAAAAHPSAGELTRPSDDGRLVVLREALVCSALLVVPGYRLAQHGLELTPVGAGGALTALLLAVLVMVRLLLSLAGQGRAHRRMRASEARFRAVFEHAGIGMALDSPDGRVLEANGALQELLARSEADIEGLHFAAFTDPEDLATDGALFDDVVAGRRSTYKLEKRFVRPDGERRWGRLIVTTAPQGEDGEPLFIGMVEDVTVARRSTERLRRRARQQAAVARLGQHALASRDVAGVEELAADLVMQTLGAATCTLDRPLAAYHGGGGVHVDGGTVTVGVSAHEHVLACLRVEFDAGAALEDDDLSFLQAVANVLAAALEHDAAQEKLEHQALHDALTGLPNRRLLLDRVEHALRRQERTGDCIAVLFVDLDRFKLVNDGLGHDAGDQVLMAVAHRLQGALRPGDTIARLGGDEFAMLCDPIATDADTVAVAERLLDALATPLEIDGHEVYITASVGAAVGQAGDRADALLREADLAMYGAKMDGRNRYALYDQGLQGAAMRRLTLSNALRHALERDELRLHYQPEIDLRTGAVVLVEALMRWEHPTLGMIPPSEFIPIAEDGALIAELGEWALRTACAEAARWTAVDGAAPAVAVNLSPKQLGQAELADLVADALRAAGLPAQRLWLEITEGAVMHEPEAAVRTLHRLSALGVNLAIDDFGTGYSSLAQLKAFPLNALKIDRSFVSGLGDDIQDSSIVAATIQLARALGLQSIAEGVETDQQLDALARLGCDIGQGYRWSRPVAAAELPARFAELSSRTAAVAAAG